MTDLDKTIAAWRKNGTPGPWCLSRFSPQFNVTGMNDRSICSTGGYQDGTEKAFKENEANAPFVAAAPAMADEIDRLRKQLKATLEREAETHRRHDQKLDAKDAHIAELEAALKYIAFPEMDELTANHAYAENRLELYREVFSDIEATRTALKGEQNNDK